MKILSPFLSGVLLSLGWPALLYAHADAFDRCKKTLVEHHRSICGPAATLLEALRHENNQLLGLSCKDYCLLFWLDDSKLGEAVVHWLSATKRLDKVNPKLFAYVKEEIFNLIRGNVVFVTEQRKVIAALNSQRLAEIDEIRRDVLQLNGVMASVLEDLEADYWNIGVTIFDVRGLYKMMDALVKRANECIESVKERQCKRLKRHHERSKAAENCLAKLAQTVTNFEYERF